jgi:signal transduction histidine kinase
MAQVTPSAPPEARPAGVERAVEEGAAMAAGLPPAIARWAASAQPLRRAVVLLLVGTSYFAAAKLGLLVAIVHTSATAVWPPTGIALASLLLLGNQAWPAIAVGAFLANITTHGSVAACAGIATGNTLEALVGAWLVRRYARGREAFFSGLDAFRFTVLAGVLATSVSATFGVLSVTLSGDATWAKFGPIWWTWWLGDMGGAFVVAPLILVWSTGPRVPWNEWTRARAVEAVCAFAALLLAGQAIFGWLAPVGSDPVVLKFLCMPILIWIAYRFDPRTAATGVFVLAAIATLGTVRGALASGPGVLNESLMLIQVYLAVTAMSTLVLAAAVHERTQAERALRATSDELREALTEVEAFSHAVSHDLRTPLSTVYNYAAVLEEDYGGQLDPDTLGRLRRIRASVRSATDLLDELVKFVWAGNPTIPKRMLDMSALAREACAELVVATEDGSAVQFDVGELPPAHGNPQMLGRVLYNLLSNAVKFTRGREARRVTISGRVEGNENVYSVVDNGVGFDPRLGEEMFRPFYQANPVRFAGAGLGLAIAAKIVRRHGGRVGAESDGTSGARFWFTLPEGGIDEPVSGGPAGR